MWYSLWIKKRNSKGKKKKTKNLQVWGQTFQLSDESSKNPPKKCANFSLCHNQSSVVQHVEKQNCPKFFVLILIDLLFLNYCITCRTQFLDQQYYKKEKSADYMRGGAGHHPDCVGAICETKATFSHLIQTPERRPVQRLNICNVDKNANNQIFKWLLY